MAAIFASPNPGRVGQPIYIVGQGFGNALEVSVEISPGGIKSEIVSTAGGSFSTAGIADHATGTLTGTGQPVAGETFTLNGRVYTMRASVATMTAAYDVLIGAALTNTLDNIVAAVNADRAGLGSLYGPGTEAHPTMYAAEKTATTVVFKARQPGTAGNALTTVEGLTNNSFGGGTLTGGAAAAAQGLSWLPQEEGMYTVTATDGTNTATPLQVQVYT